MRIGFLALALLLALAPPSLAGPAPCCEPNETCCDDERPACPLAPVGRCLAAADGEEPATRAERSEAPVLGFSRPLPRLGASAILPGGTRAREPLPPRTARYLLYESLRN